MHQAIKHYMTPEPRHVQAGDSVHRARQIMQAAGIRHLPVLERGKCVGIVTERDIRLLETAGARSATHETGARSATHETGARSATHETGRAGTEVEVREAMTPEPFVVGLEAPLAEVARVMADRKYGSAIVMHEGKVVGIFSVVDAMRALAELFAENFEAPSSDRWGNVERRGLRP